MGPLARLEYHGRAGQHYGELECRTMHQRESWVAAAGVAVATTHGNTVLLDRQRGQYFVLSETGGVVWRLVRRPGGATVDDMVAALDAEFDVPAERVRSDVEALLGQLKRARLAKVTPA